MSQSPSVVVPVAALGLLVLVAGGGLLIVDSAGQQSRDPPRVTSEQVPLVQPAPNASEKLWPYTSRGKRFESATLPINMVFRTDAETTRYLLRVKGDQHWENHSTRYAGNRTVGIDLTESANRTNGSTPAANGSRDRAGPDTDSGTPTTFAPTRTAETAAVPPNGSLMATATNRTPASATPTASGPVVAVNGTTIEWRRSHGAARYTYIHNESGDGRWLDSTYQLHNGDYFGTRSHVRLYEGGPNGSEWTAIQAHREHWDWFGLKHDVGSLAIPQYHIEREFYEPWYVTDVSRERYGNGGAGDYDGWVSVVGFHDDVIVPPRLFLFPFLAGAVLSARGVLAGLERALATVRETDRLRRHHALLFAGVAAVPLVVRYGALATERAVPTASPYLVGAPFYLLLVVGLPVVAAVFARPLDPADAIAVSVVALGTGLLGDYATLGVTVIELGVVFHRIGVLVALGAIAGAVATDEAYPWRSGLVALGVLAWTTAILWPLVGP